MSDLFNLETDGGMVPFTNNSTTGEANANAFTAAMVKYGKTSGSSGIVTEFVLPAKPYYMGGDDGVAAVANFRHGIKIRGLGGYRFGGYDAFFNQSSDGGNEGAVSQLIWNGPTYDGTDATKFSMLKLQNCFGAEVTNINIQGRPIADVNAWNAIAGGTFSQMLYAGIKFDETVSGFSSGGYQLAVAFQCCEHTAWFPVAGTGNHCDHPHWSNYMAFFCRHGVLCQNLQSVQHLYDQIQERGTSPGGYVLRYERGGGTLKVNSFSHDSPSVALYVGDIGPNEDGYFIDGYRADNACFFQSGYKLFEVSAGSSKRTIEFRGAVGNNDGGAYPNSFTTVPSDQYLSASLNLALLQTADSTAFNKYGGSPVNLSQTLSDGTTVGEALVAARAGVLGKQTLNKDTAILTTYAADGTTVIGTAAIGPNLQTPLTRTPQ